MNKVLKFINDFVSFSPEILKNVFYNGYCYWFALILAERFKGEIWFNPTIVHFATKINNTLYDINGIVETNNDWISWEEFQWTRQEAVKSIVDSCIKKK